MRTVNERTREPEVRTEAPRYDAVLQEPPVSQPEENNAEAAPETAPEAEPEDDALSNSSLKSVSGNGTKETYSLEDGSTAVLQYNNDELENGYIIEGEIE